MAAKLWGKVPVLLKIQCVSVLAVVIVPLLVVHGRVDERPQWQAFAIPAGAGPSQAWDQEVQAFADKVSQAFGVQRSTASQFADWILEASERQDLDPELLASLVHTESTFRKQARSRVGAVGPAQVRPQMWSQFCGPTNLLDPAENI
jgi:soluble lytic murein transglycosylase-like protein